MKCYSGPSVSGGGGGGADPARLTQEYPYDSIWFDASALVPQASNGPAESRLSIPTSNKRYNALVYDPSVVQTAYLSWPEHVGYVNWSAPAFRIRIFAISPTGGSGTEAVMQVGSSNLYVSDGEQSYSISTFASLNMTGRSAYDRWIGNAGNDSAAVALPTPNGRALVADSNTEVNNLTFALRRNATSASDTFTGDLYVIGVAIQFATDFNNITQWTL